MDTCATIISTVVAIDIGRTIKARESATLGKHDGENRIREAVAARVLKALKLSRGNHGVMQIVVVYPRTKVNSHGGDPKNYNRGGAEALHGLHDNRGAPSGCRPPSTSSFAPSAANPFHEHLEALAVAAPRLLGEAPPDFRLSAVSYRIAALERQLRQQVALVRLCYGDSSLEMVQAIADLAEGYAKEGLWPQVSNHMGRASSILARDHQVRSCTTNGGALTRTPRAWLNGDLASRIIPAASRCGHHDDSARGAGAEGDGGGLAFSTRDR
eukprot:g4572.t2